MFGLTDQASIIAAGVNLFLTLYVLVKFRGWNRSLNRYFSVLSFGFVLWNFGVANESRSLVYLGVFLLPPAFYTFMLALLRQLNRREQLISVFLGSFCGVIILISLWGLNREPVSRSFISILNILAFVISTPVFVYSLWRLASRARLTRSHLEQSRLTFVLAGTTAAGIAGVTAALTALGYSLESWTSIAGLIYTVSITIAIMRYRLFDFGRFFSRMMVVLIVSILLWSLFGVLGKFHIDEHSITFLSVLVAALIVVMLYEPLKTFVEEQAYRVQRSNTVSFLDTLDQFSSSINSYLDVNTLISVFSDHLAKPERIHSFGIYTADFSANHFVLVKSGNTLPLPTEVSPLPKAFFNVMLSRKGPISRNRLNIELRSGLPRLIREEKLQLYRIMNRLRASVVFPFVAGDRLYGFLSLSLSDPDSNFTQSEEDALDAVTRQFASALAHLRLEHFYHAREHLVSLGRLASGLAHEIRNPLATIKAGVQYLEPESFSGHIQEFLTIIREEVDRLDRFVNRFLAYARPYSRDIDQPMSPLNDVLHTVKRSISTRPEAGCIQIETVIRDDTHVNPAIPADIWTQILDNCVMNAIQAIGQNGVVRITVTVFSKIGVMEVAVEDNGPGIPEHEWPLLFEPFYSKRKGGTGLGLAIVRQLVHGLNGDIRCAHTLLGGAGIFIRVPFG